MCRIAGIFIPDADNVLRDISLMRDAMHRGGPDSEGLYIDKDFTLAFGHRRLALIDLSPSGQQPMSEDEGQLQIIFNGEIYNFKELKVELEVLGYQFNSLSDTEVVVKAYHAWGVNCFAKFNGMFALAIFDKKNSRVILARDHAGIKPLYYYQEENKLIFASEIRAFKALNPQWESHEGWQNIFLAFGHLPEPVTTLKNVKPIPKGSYSVFDLLTYELKINSFYRYDFAVKTQDYETAKEIIKNKLTNAVKRHLISDAPIGLFLSGGVDSSLLTILSQPILKDNLQTLSIVFEEQEFSESEYQNIVIDQTGAKHKQYIVTQQDFENSLEDIFLAMDQPSTDGVNSYFISRYAHEAGLKAVLSGIGGDELFGGYTSFSVIEKLQFIRPFASTMASILGKLNDKYKKLQFLKIKGNVGYYLAMRGLLSVDEIYSVTGSSKVEIVKQLNELSSYYKYNLSSAWNKASWIELNFYMQNQLLKDSDFMSMWHGLEIRVPFLDKEVIAAATATSHKLKKSKIGKRLLIDSFEKQLPERIWNRKRKGFTFPFAKWIGGENNNHTIFFKKAHWSKNWAIRIMKEFDEKS